MLAKPRILYYLFSSTRLINSTKYEHLCKILYFMDFFGRINLTEQGHFCKVYMYKRQLFLATGPNQSISHPGCNGPFSWKRQLLIDLRKM